MVACRPGARRRRALRASIAAAALVTSMAAMTWAIRNPGDVVLWTDRVHSSVQARGFDIAKRSQPITSESPVAAPAGEFVTAALAPGDSSPDPRLGIAAETSPADLAAQ